MESSRTPEAQAIAEEGVRLRGFIASKYSDTLLKLFDVLLACSIAGQRLKESEIAERVFGGDTARPESHGSRVRVAIYRLRRKMDAYYERASGPRLIIPQGAYVFVLAEPEAVAEPDAPPEDAPVAPSRRRRPAWLPIAAVVIGNLLGAGVYFSLPLWRPATPPIWQPFSHTSRPTILAIGDYFLFLSAENHPGVVEVTQDLSIDTVQAFEAYRASTPAAQNRVTNQDLYAVSSDIVGAIRLVERQLPADRVRPIGASKVDADLLKSSNIVYIGALDALSPFLGNPLFQASQFTCGVNCYELVDRPSGKRFVSDSRYRLADMIIPRRDYGYIASYPGPTGNQILVISGTGDAGVMQMAQLLGDPERMKELQRRIGGNARAFEALYQVRTMFNEAYGSTLLIARPIGTTGIWDRTKRRDWRPSLPPQS